MNDDPVDAADAHIAAYGPAGRPPREVIGALTEAPHTLDGLVARTALPRRAVERLLEVLAADLEGTAHGWSIRPERRDAYRERFDWARLQRTRLPDPLDERIAGSPALLGRFEQLVAAAPRPERSLDHVTATPRTMARRAYWMDAIYDLSGTRVLCVGDHDLTSLAACAVNPGTVVTVVDLDERILAFIDEEATANGWRVRCLYGDLRHELPAPAADWADLVFTDPPYTPAGVGLFLRRGLEGIRARDHGRLLLAYGFGEDHPALGLKVQREMQRLHLAFEAVLPGFHRYHGAQAIGGAADLYVCRPTSRTWRALEADGGAVDAANLYTRGSWAQERRAVTMDLAVAEPVAALATGHGGDSAATAPLPVLAGGSWPAETSGAARLSLPRMLTRGGATRGRPLAVDLSDAPDSWLLRVLLCADAPRVAVLVPNRYPDLASEASQAGFSDLVRCKYAIRWHRSFPGPSHAVIEAFLVPPDQLAAADTVARHVLDRAHGKVANTWREGLIRLSRGLVANAAPDVGRGGSGGPLPASTVPPLSKNAARELVRRHARRHELLDARLIDLPRHQLAELLIDVSASTQAMAT